MNLARLIGLLSSLCLGSSPVWAAEPAPAPPPDRGDRPWIRRWAPEPHTADIGFFGGAFLPSERLELFEVDRRSLTFGFEPWRRAIATVGGRIGYFPNRFFGFEVEGIVSPTSTMDAEELEVVVWQARGQAVLQVGLWSVTPFVLGGAAALGVASSREAVGTDVDPGFHFGGGIKVFVNRQASFRLEARDIVSAARGEGVTQSFEVLAGVTFTLGRKPRPAVPIPVDRDEDGVADPDDACPDEAGIALNLGCPAADADEDGVQDRLDACPSLPAPASHRGCPPPVADQDGDGILDARDPCPEAAGSLEDRGCPDLDQDDDGVIDDADPCPRAPENVNGFEDGDGCPDDIPTEVASFTGVIEGIAFSVSSAAIERRSRPKLQRAVEILQKYPELRIEISGHTDDRGDDEQNLELSRQRAESVQRYLVEAGVAPQRIRTRGAGETEPLDTNLTAEGRANNRRIEFRLLSD